MGRGFNTFKGIPIMGRGFNTFKGIPIMGIADKDSSPMCIHMY